MGAQKGERQYKMKYSPQFRTITVSNVPAEHLKKINQLIQEGYYLNQSEFIRHAIRDLLDFHFPKLETIRFNLGLTECEERIIIEERQDEDEWEELEKIINYIRGYKE